jgi:hypothetical protein
MGRLQRGGCGEGEGPGRSDHSRGVRGPACGRPLRRELRARPPKQTKGPAAKAGPRHSRGRNRALALSGSRRERVSPLPRPTEPSRRPRPHPRIRHSRLPLPSRANPVRASQPRESRERHRLTGGGCPGRPLGRFPSPSRADSLGRPSLRANQSSTTICAPQGLRTGLAGVASLCPELHLGVR